MTAACLPCGSLAEGHFRPFLDRGRLDRHGIECAWCAAFAEEED